MTLVEFSRGHAIDVAEKDMGMARFGVPRGGPCDVAGADIARRLVSATQVYEIVGNGGVMRARAACSYEYVGADCNVRSGSTATVERDETTVIDVL